jgi:hypothetical protein
MAAAANATITRIVAHLGRQELMLLEAPGRILKLNSSILGR